MFPPAQASAAYLRVFLFSIKVLPIYNSLTLWIMLLTVRVCQANPMNLLPAKHELNLKWSESLLMVI